MDGKELRAFRLKLDITQAQMGDLLGISGSLVSKLEKGAKMNRSISLLLASLQSGQVASRTASANQ